jgi:metal-responsive CopG/Arc/MetJ family transcriptional regulator
MENGLFEKFNELSEDTMIPKSKLLDEAIKLLLEKFNKNNKENE